MLSNWTKEDLAHNVALASFQQIIEPNESNLYGLDDHGSLDTGCISQVNGKDLDVVPILTVEYNQVAHQYTKKSFDESKITWYHNPITIDFPEPNQDCVSLNQPLALIAVIAMAVLILIVIVLFFKFYTQRKKGTTFRSLLAVFALI